MKESEEISQRTYMHICIVHGHRQQCGKARQGGGGGRVEGDREGNRRDICNSINNKINK